VRLCGQLEVDKSKGKGGVRSILHRLRKSVLAGNHPLGTLRRISRSYQILLKCSTGIRHHIQGGDHAMNVVVLKDFGESGYGIVIHCDDSGTDFFL